MPGEYDQKFQNLRAMLGYMIAHPGKKLSFMGNEFGQFIEWRYDRELDWLLLRYDRHRQCQDFVRALNRLYLEQPPLWENDSDWEGFQWIEPDDADESLFAFRRIDREGREILAIFNFCPVPRPQHSLGVPGKGRAIPLLNSDETRFGGTGTQISPVSSEPVPYREYKNSCRFDIPPMSATFYAWEPAPEEEPVPEEKA